MAWFDEFSKLPITTRNIILSLAMQLPFWLIAIYLLNKPLYNSGDYLIIGAFCFCFSVTWYFLGGLNAAMAAQMNNKKRDIHTIYVVGGIVSVLYLSVAIIVSHYFSLSFKTFLIISYSYMLIAFFKSVIRLEMKQYDDKQKKSNSDSKS
ncbi:MAG TPA: hypothetical protein DIS90_14875 [Cytophagales bacterium]|nr:hypothetical protein [Flavobacteriales bacterium]HCM77663.1 hypothetical protein [Cytophagales bacterium]HRE74726.1 hypothetical protein [Flavobacteriales bacterium]HRJ37972.1 hypothetical protein [Flavobacteriales bacterium]